MSRGPTPIERWRSLCLSWAAGSPTDARGLDPTGRVKVQYSSNPDGIGAAAIEQLGPASSVVKSSRLARKRTVTKSWPPSCQASVTSTERTAMFSSQVHAALCPKLVTLGLHRRVHLFGQRGTHAPMSRAIHAA